jgi:hypothetical protein
VSRNICDLGIDVAAAASRHPEIAKFLNWEAVCLPNFGSSPRVVVSPNKRRRKESTTAWLLQQRVLDSSFFSPSSFENHANGMDDDDDDKDEEFEMLASQMHGEP